MKLLKIFSLAVVFYTISYCQSDKWINYFGPTQINSIAAEGEYLWIGTDINITKINVSTGDLKFFRNKELGLPEDPVAAIAVDNQGNKWVGKKGGELVKYDGTNWIIQNYPALSSPDHRLNSISIDSHENKWIATFAGLTKYDGTTWTQYNTSNSGLPSDAVYSVAFDSAGNKWIGTSEGLVRYNDTAWTVYNTSNSGLMVNYVSPVAIDHSGNIWMGNSTSGLAKFDGTNWTVFTTANSSLPDNFINFIFVDAQGNKWFGTEGGLAEYDDHNWTSYKYISSGAQINKVTSIAADQTGKIWIGTELHLAKYDNSKWIEYKYWNSGLPANNITLIAIDHDGNKWMLAGGIVTFFDGKTWKTYTSSNSALPDNRTLSIAIDPGGSKWFGTLDGKIIKFDGTSWTTYTLPVQGSVPAIDFDSKGNTWIGVDEAGVLKFSNNSWTIYNQFNSGLPRNAVLSLAVDLNENVWAGSYHGDLVEFNGASWTRFSEYFTTRVISVDKAGNVWIRADNILAKYNGSSWTSYVVPAGTITSIQFDSSGNKWIGLNVGGIAEFDDYNWTVYNSSNSDIVSNTIYSVAVDPADNKWIGSYYGLSVYREGGVILVMPPAAPRLVSVADHSKDQALSLRLSWNKSEGAETYHLQLAKDSLFKNLIIDESGLSSLSKDVTGLLNSTTYYWRVRAKGASGVSPWSEVWSFSTIQALATAPVLSLPKNNSTDNPLALKLLWRANKNTDRYRLIVAGDDKFTNIIFHDSTLTDTLKEVKDLKEGMKYYWKVCSSNSAGEGPFSEVWNLITILYAPRNLEASVQNDKKIKLKWEDKSKTVTGFVIERKQNADFIPIDTVKASSTNYTDSKASQASTYHYRIKAYTPFAVSAYSNTVSVTLTGVDELALIPKEFRLFQNYPNPFNPSTIISYTLPVESSVRLIIYNSLGETLKEFAVKSQSAGIHEISIDAERISSGVYFYMLEATASSGTKSFRQIKKMIILK